MPKVTYLFPYFETSSVSQSVELLENRLINESRKRKTAPIIVCRDKRILAQSWIQRWNKRKGDSKISESGIYDFEEDSEAVLYYLTKVTHPLCGNRSTKMSGKADLGPAYHKNKLISLVILENPTWVNANLRAEASNAGKFDDIIVEYSNKRGVKECLCYQVKHKEKENAKIKAEDLLTQKEMITVQDVKNEDKKRYGLLKYFFSYEELKREGTSKYGTVKHVILFTNENFHMKDLTENGIEIVGHFGKLDSTDYLLNKMKFKKRNQTAPARYRITRVPELRKKCLDYLVIREARKLITCILNKTEIRNDTFPDCNGALAQKVIDVKTKKFREEFIKGIDLSEDIAKFRDVFSREIEETFKLELDGMNDAVDHKKVVLKLSEEFGQGCEGGSSTMSITDARITEFLENLVFVVNQSNADELETIIKEEMRTKLNPTTTETTFDQLDRQMKKLIRWKIPKLSIEECREIYEKEIRLSGIWFDVKPPVALFTGRKKELRELHELLQSRDEVPISPRVAIHGLGGVGKTELARQHISLHSQDYEGNVIWINAESRETLSKSFHRLEKFIRKRLGIKIEDDQIIGKDIESIVAEVYTFFLKKKSLFIFDNAEIWKVQSNSDLKIYDFLPNSPPPGAKSPCVLTTSRNEKWEECMKLQLEVFGIDEAVELIKEALTQKDVNDDSDIKNLAEELQFLPLALRQAVAYINENDKLYEFRVADFLKEYKTNSAKLLDHPGPFNYTNTILTTWNITIEKLKKLKECLALEILNIVAYFNSDDIPTSMFLELIAAGNKNEKLLDSIKCLTQYSMVSSVKTSTLPIISIHRSVQEVFRIKLRENSNDPNEKSILKKALELFENGINPHNVDHAECVWNHASKHTDLVKKFAHIPVDIVTLLDLTDEPNRAISFGKRAGELLAENIGLDDIRTAATFDEAATAAISFGQIRVARELFAKVNETNIRKLNAVFHPEILQLLEDQSVDKILTSQGCFEFVMGSNGPARFKERTSLSLHLCFLGYVGAARIILGKNSKDITANYNPSKVSRHDVACEYYNNHVMGIILGRLGEYKEALQCFTKLNENIKSMDYGASVVLSIRHEMATIMLHRCDYGGVLKFYHEDIERMESSAYKKRTCDYMYVAAKALEASGEYDKSLEIAYKAYDILTSLDGIHDYTIIPRISHIASLWHKLGQNELAIQYYDEAFQRLKTSSSRAITYYDILYTRLCIIDIEHETKSREIALSALKELSKETKNRLDAKDRCIKFLENYVDRWVKGEDNGLDNSQEFPGPTIFTDHAKIEYAQRTISFPLHHATERNRLDIVKCLVELAEYDVDDKDDRGVTGLQWAVGIGNIQIVNYLLSRNADLRMRSNDGSTPLHVAALKGHCEIVEVLLRKGAAVNEENVNGFTALSFTAYRGHLEVVKILLNSAANVNTKFKIPDPSILNPMSPDFDTKHRFERIAAILELTKSLFTTIKNNDLSERKKLEKLRHCSTQGAILGATNNRDYGILDYAVHQKSEEIVKFLVEQGADIIRVTNIKGYTTLYIAVIKDCVKIVNYLLQHVSRDKLSGFVNAQTTKLCRTALHVAAENNNTDIVKILLENGADCNVKNARNETALDLAETESEVRNILVNCC